MEAGWNLYEGKDPYLFISYSHADRSRVFPILRELEERGYRFWFDAGIYAGDPWTGTLAERISHCAVFLPFLSPAFVVSPNCLQEVRKGKKKIIVPVWLEKVDRNAIDEEFSFLMNEAQELRVDRFADAAAFAAHLQYEKHFRPCLAPASASAPEPNTHTAPAEPVTRDEPMSPSPAFVGREETMDEIEQAFRDGASVFLLYGMGGMGKSEICRKLYRKWRTGTDLARRVGWITWRDAGGPDTAPKKPTIAKLKETFYGQFPQIDETDMDRYWQKTRTLLRDRDLLLILDNGDSMEDRDAAALAQLGCRFLITSRRNPARLPSIPETDTAAADTLTVEQCRVLYRRAYDGPANRKKKDTAEEKWNDDSPEPVLDGILRLAGYHTLTVYLLAKTQKAARLTKEALLEQLRDKGIDLSGVPEEITYSHRPEAAMDPAAGDTDAPEEARFMEHMARIFDLSVLRTHRKGEDALRVLRGMSLLAPNTSVKKETVQKWLGLDDLNGLNHAVNTGWLNVTEDGDSVSIHPVIAAVVRRAAPPDAELADAVAGELFEDMVLEVTEVFKAKVPVMAHAAALDRAAQSLSLCTGNYGGMLHQLGYLTKEQGDYDTALEWYQKALAVYETVLGRDHPSTATTYHNIGTNYYEQGNFAEALQWLNRAEAVRMRVLGPDHPYTKNTQEWIDAAKQELSRET